MRAHTPGENRQRYRGLDWNPIVFAIRNEERKIKKEGRKEGWIRSTWWSASCFQSELDPELLEKSTTNASAKESRIQDGGAASNRGKFETRD